MRKNHLRLAYSQPSVASREPTPPDSWDDPPATAEPGWFARLGKNICLIPAAIVVLGIALLMRFGGKPMRY